MGSYSGDRHPLAFPLPTRRERLRTTHSRVRKKSAQDRVACQEFFLWQDCETKVHVVQFAAVRVMQIHFIWRNTMIHPSAFSRLSCIFACIAALLGPAQADPLLTYPLKIRGHEIRAEAANTENSRRQGLMFRDRMGENAGMIFLYPRPEPTAMWMKNTRIPLSVAFIDRSGRILNIEDMAPFSEEAHASRGEAAFALEVNRGWFGKRGIRAGDRVEGLSKLPPAE